MAARPQLRGGDARIPYDRVIGFWGVSESLLCRMGAAEVNARGIRRCDVQRAVHTPSMATGPSWRA
jgi:hypothetical protein